MLFLYCKISKVFSEQKLIWLMMISELVLDEYISSFITYKIEPGILTFEDLSEALFSILQSEHPGPSNVIDNEFDDITMKTKLVVRNGIIATRFHEKSFFSVILAFTPHWD